jgi:hypothetical protein
MEMFIPDEDHPTFREFKRWEGHVVAGYAVNAVGQKTDVEFLRGFGLATPERMKERVTKGDVYN